MSGELDPRAAGANGFATKSALLQGLVRELEEQQPERLREEDSKIVVVNRIDESASRAVTELSEPNVGGGQNSRERTLCKLRQVSRRRPKRI